jgi:hypothetical protein
MEYFYKTEESTPGAPKRILCMFLLRYAANKYESKLGVPKKIYA